MDYACGSAPLHRPNALAPRKRAGKGWDPQLWDFQRGELRKALGQVRVPNVLEDILGKGGLDKGLEERDVLVLRVPRAEIARGKNAKFSLFFSRTQVGDMRTTCHLWMACDDDDNHDTGGSSY